MADSRRKGSGFLKATGIFKRKNCWLVLFRTMFKTSFFFMCFSRNPNGWKKYATLLPKNWLTETPQTLASRRLGRQSAEREPISEINWNF
ncbi:hypothetical protein DOZ91_08800 [Peribacillus frigoritolerans]|nr:hypothetical protein DOZ91_08800 [Peribacillus frigoritolerans]